MKISILGCAHVHTLSYVHSLRELNVEIIGATDMDFVAGKEFCSKNNIDFFDNLDTLLSMEQDAVLICSENIYHKEYTISAAKKGVHVIVEKPIATTIEDGEAMISACKENSVLLMICFPVRYTSPIIEAKASIDNGEIGELQSIVATNHGTMPGGWFVKKELSGGGAVIDHTVHVADIMNWIMNSKIKTVDSVMDTLIHPIDVEDCGLILLEFENGVIGSIDTSWNRPKSFLTWGDVVIDFIGTKGSLKVDAFLERGLIYSDNAAKVKSYGFGNNSDHFMLKDFIDAIENNKCSPISGEDGLFALDIALKAYNNVTK